MNFSENHDSIRNSLENDNSQFYQNNKKSENSNRQTNTKHENKQSFPNNINMKNDGPSRLNYYSSPFIPKQFQNINDSKALRPDISGDSTNRMPSDHDHQFYSQSANVNYDGYNSNMTNQCLYSPYDFVPLWYHFNNPGTHSNYWPIVANSNYLGLSNLGLSTSLEPNQNMFMVGKTSENSLNSSNTYNSAINNLESNFNSFSLNPQSKSQPISHVQNTRKNPQLIKTNNSGNVNVEAPAPGIQWNYDVNNLNENFPKHIKNSNSADFNLSHSEQYKSENIEKSKEILNCISDPEIKKSLSETMQNINPIQFPMFNVNRARFFVIKSYSEDDLHRAIKYGVWCSTKTGNAKLDSAYQELNHVSSSNQEPGRLFLFFSVNGSGFFAGIAEMISRVNFEESCGFWSQNKWVGRFEIKWHYVKDVRNSNLRHIRSEANENKPVTNSRDAVEVTPFENGIEFIKVFHHAKHETSVFDDFEHYERRENDPTLNV